MFDALLLARRVSVVYDFVSEGELHTLAYLAALLAVYAGESPTWWGYDFYRVSPAAPYSGELAEAIGVDIRVGLFSIRDRNLAISGRGKRELALWRTLPENRRREPYLNAAADAAIHLSLPRLGRSIEQEPMLSRATMLSSERRLLDPSGLADLRAQFDAVATALAEHAEVVPAPADDVVAAGIVWLEYLRASSDAAAA
jgi:hypothetical protein